MDEIVERCHRKWRQIGLLAPNQGKDVRPEMSEHVLRTKSLVAVNEAIRKLRTISMFPELANFLFRRVSIGEEEINRIEDKLGDQFINSFLAIMSAEHKNYIWRKGVISNDPKDCVDSCVADMGHETRNTTFLMTCHLEILNLQKNAAGMHSNKKLVLFFKKQDKLQRQFFQQLLNSKSLILPSETNESKQSIVRLLKHALKGRYSSHVKDALKERDLQSLICILSIIAQNYKENSSDEEAEFVQNLDFEISDCDLSRSYNTSKRPSPSESLSKFFDYHALDIQHLDNSDVENDSNYLNENIDTTMIQDNNSYGSLEYIPKPSPKCNPKMLEYSAEESQADKPIDTDKAKSYGSKSCILHKNKHQQGNNSYLKTCLHQILNVLQNHPSLKQGIYNFQNNRKMILKDHLLPTMQGTLEIMNLFKNLLKGNKYAGRITDTAANKTGSSMRTSTLHDIKKSASVEENDARKALFLEREQEIQNLQLTLEALISENDELVLQTVVTLEEDKEIADKRHNMKMTQLKNHAKFKQQKLQNTIEILDGGYHGLKSYRKDLELKLYKITKEYDDYIANQKGVIEELERIKHAKEAEISSLQEIYGIVEEKYEEMTTTRRLKELLGKLQMAEEVKENWAARRIQAAWKRYKIMKLRKRRLKKGAGKKKKKKAEDEVIPKAIKKTEIKSKR